jgi:hypothetical protein
MLYLQKLTMQNQVSSRHTIMSLFTLIALISSVLYGVKFNFSPIYVLLPSFFLIFATTRFWWMKLDLPAMLMIAPILIGILNSFQINGSSINFLLSFCGYIFVFSIVSCAIKYRVEHVLLQASYAIAIILTLDSIYRILHPQAPTAEMAAVISDRGQWFYFYKFGSLMFADSNTTGLVALTWAAVIEYINRYVRPISRALRIVFPILIIFTFSRSAMIGLAVLLFICGSRQIRIFYAVGAIALAMIYYETIYGFLTNDGSAQSKLTLFEWLTEYYRRQEPIALLFGNGLGSSESVMGMFGHNILVTLYLDLGLVGLLFCVSNILAILVLYPRTTLLVGPMSVCSMSYFLYEGAPFYSMPLAAIAAHSTLVTSTRPSPRKNN